MFGESRRELQRICEILDDITLAGFSANAEIAGNRQYGHTTVLTLFSAKTPVKPVHNSNPKNKPRRILIIINQYEISALATKKKERRRCQYRNIGQYERT